MAIERETFSAIFNATGLGAGEGEIYTELIAKPFSGDVELFKIMVSLSVAMAQPDTPPEVQYILSTSPLIETRWAGVGASDNFPNQIISHYWQYGLPLNHEVNYGGLDLKANDKLYFMLYLRHTAPEGAADFLEIVKGHLTLFYREVF